MSRLTHAPRRTRANGGGAVRPSLFSAPPTHLKRGVWREEVRARAGWLESQATELTGSSGIDRSFVEDHVLAPLAAAVRLTESPEDLAEAWSGSQIEEAWRNLRLAEIGLVQATTDPEAVAGYARAAQASAAGRLPADDPRLVALANALTAKHPKIRRLRPATLEVLAAAHEVSDQSYRTQRGFRATLRVLALVLAVLAVLVAVLSATLWRTSTVLAQIVSAPPELEGGQGLALAVLVGAIGALFSAIPSIAQTSGTATAFSTRAHQALLKVAVGAWSGPFGLIIATAGLSQGTGTDPAAGAPSTATVAGFIMAAAFFGATQEALTRFADVKAAHTP